MAPRNPSAQTSARARLQRAGLRITAARLRVIALLAAGDAPLNAQEVAQRLGGGADRVTVYRTLNTLVEAGIAHRVDPGDRVYRFGLSAPAERPASAHRHPHLVCDECGAMECVEDAEVIVRARPARPPAGSPQASGRHWRVTRQEVLLRGTCGDCKPRPARKQSPSRARRTA